MVAKMVEMGKEVGKGMGRSITLCCYRWYRPWSLRAVPK